LANNLFVSYDLYSLGQNYDKVIEVIKSKGNWAKVQKSLWYLKTVLSAQSVAEAVWAVMDTNDSLIVIDTTNNSAAWHNLNPEVSKFLQENWLT
jgi:hypothetical protein